MTYKLNSLFRCIDAPEAQRGTATLTAVLILALLGVFTAAAMSRVTTGQAIMNNDLGNSKAFYAAQASLEEMTRNFDNIFSYRLYPTSTDLAAVQNRKPSIPGYNYTQIVTAMTTPSPGVVTISTGPFSGLQALKDSWKLDATATSWNSSEVHLTREFNNFKIPIFQFGIFYNRDLTIHPGPVMYFSGRVHSNANIFVMAGNSVYFTNRVTAAGEIIRDWARNGKTLSQGGWTGKVFIGDPSGTAKELLAANGSTYYGSVIPGSGSGFLAGNPLNPDPGMAPNNDANYTQWKSATDSGIFGGNLQAHVPLLQLPLQIGSGKDPIELIKRGINSNDYQAAVLGQPVDDPITSLSRYCNKPGIRVSLSDSQAELPGGTGGVRLDGASDGLGGDMNTDGSRGYLPQAMPAGNGNPAYQATRINGFRLYGGANYPDNGNAGSGSNIPAKRQTWIKVEIVNVDSNQNVTTSDITQDFLSMGMTAVAPDLVDTSGNQLGDSRAILKMQRFEIPGAPVRVVDVNVVNTGDTNLTSPSYQFGLNSGINTTTMAQAAPLPAQAGLAPTTANYVFQPAGSSGQIAVGPFNLFTFQTASGSVGAFNYVSMTNNNYSPSMAGDPASTTVNGYSVFTNVHQNANGTLQYFNGGVLSQLSNTLGNNIWGTNALAYGTTTTLPVGVTGFTAPPAYPSGYQLSSTVVPPAYTVSVVVGTSNPVFKLTVGSATTAALPFNPTAPTAAQVQTALQGLTTVGVGNCLVSGPTGAGTTASPYVYSVYFANPAFAPSPFTGTQVNGAGAPTGSVTVAAPSASARNVSALSIESTAHGKTAQINSATVRTETVVPFPIEVFNPREGLWSADTTYDPTQATTNPNWYSLYANGKADQVTAGMSGTNVPTWAGSDIPAAGVMSLIDIDVANLRTFLNGRWDSNFTNGLTSSQIPTNPGWILYVSDRRGDRDFDGEYDMEDIYGPLDGTLQAGEDANGNGRLDVDVPGTLSPNPFGLPANSAGTEAVPYTAGVPSDVAAFFDHQYFRRGVRLINGSQLPGSEFAGFTLATENPAYTFGSYNTTGVSVHPANSTDPPTTPAQYIPAWDASGNNTPAGATNVQVPASIAADAVYVLSNTWKDASSFRWPMAQTTQPSGRTDPNGLETSVRVALFMGATQGSILARPNQGGNDACLDGGVHNFPRFLENWGANSGGTFLNYCGSLINPFYSRQAVGAFKLGNDVYTPPKRNWTFDSSFLDITRCPPGTPLFQFVQRTGFRQTTRQES